MTATKAPTGTVPAHFDLLAPVDGILVPLEDLPDEVFASKMMGEGIAIDPLGQAIVAPCAGTVAQIHRAHHALTVRTADGVSVLIHVGLDTVTLAGRGFTLRVAEGQVVTAGQPLLEFDLDAIARDAMSALTVLVVTEGGSATPTSVGPRRVRSGQDPVVHIVTEARASSASTDDPGGPEIVSEPVTIVNPSGLHARPAARLANAAKAFESRIRVLKGEREASATSVTDLMALDIARGDQIRISARGPDAASAIAFLARTVGSGLGESDDDVASHRPDARRFESRDPNVLGGIPASGGLLVGRVKHRSVEVPQFDARAANPKHEVSLLEDAVRRSLAALRREQAAFAGAGEVAKAQIFEAHLELLGDDSWVTEAKVAIDAGTSAPAAWQSVVNRRADKLADLRGALMQERADDVRDVGHRVLLRMLGIDAPRVTTDRDTVLVCDTLTPSAAAYLDPTNVGAFATAQGGATSHAAIIARSMGVPYVAGLSEALRRLHDGDTVILDGDEGWIRVQPTAAQLAEARAAIETRNAAHARMAARRGDPAKLRDGLRIEVAANIGNAKDAEFAVQNGCDGVGLLRSEFLFLNRRTAPTEPEQRTQFEQIGKALGPERTLVVRTLDVGGDKPLSYMPLPAEDNPFLGIRGVRLSFLYPDLFAAQIRAALSAAPHTKLHIMFPMIGQVSEFIRAKAIVLAQMRALGVENVSLGIMVEIPSAALLAPAFAKEVDFFSIGTNDLTQYTLAIDRGHPELASHADAADPSILRLIDMTCRAAHRENKWVGVCGGLAADLLAVPALVGLGVRELSVPAPDIPKVKALLRSLRTEDCERLAGKVLSADGAPTVRSLLRNFATALTPSSQEPQS